ncbi:hypothetical protein PBI_DISMAS_56 [Microbacterium phage Dismas]|uniref:Uncharacterized protein n=2 Tax=Dismasvirus dismas TaxID=2560588 RepID=A0A2H5BFT0_9CAUD|nr:hypothetical protein FDJ24_gp56 [Microbacterium phage Dismas]AUG84853.1 hypothetical protein PBI_DISMAS_56 [Microbacterium phage Dismas]AVR57216.1 hypothetical protein PBI_KIERAN_55 [Microbacterium phage Kieran]UYL86843.1 hypothetical protein SEA_RONA_55 [Microbacterium phage Rona]WNM67376.1 hypothetical protein SEA_CHILIPEPPER_55 [Microbacterium phage ChiliPepper]
MSNTNPAVKALRKAVDAAKGPAEGTVVRFVRTVSGEYDPIRDQQVVVRKRRLTYAALFVAGSWYLTGTTREASRPTSHRAFVELLASPEVSQVQVATAFETVSW